MPALYTIYQRLRGIDDIWVDRGMAAALPTADPEAVRLIALSLLDRQQHEGAVALVRHYDRLPPDLQNAVAQAANNWYRPLREAAGDQAQDGPANVIRIVVAAKAVRLAYLVAEQLHHRPPPMRAQAAQGLFALASWASQAVGQGRQDEKQGQPRCDANALRYVQISVEEAVKLYHTHHQPDTLLALAQLAPHGIPGVWRYFEDPKSVAVETMHQLLADADSPGIRRAMLALVQVPTLTDAALQGLMKTCLERQLGDTMACAHLLLDPRAAAAIRQVPDAKALWPSGDTVERWPAHQTRGLARWVVTLPWSPSQQIEKLGQLGALPDAMSRLAVLRQLMAMADRGHEDLACPLIASFCDDPDQQLAWIALWCLIGHGWQGLPKLLPHLISSPHPRVAGLARDRLAPIGFDRLWAGWPRLDPSKRRSIGQALIKIDRRFHSHLSKKLTSAQPCDTLRALAMIHHLNQGVLFEKALLLLMKLGDTKIASAAARALGTARSQRAVEALEAALHHHDSRVRANAVEALQQLRSTRHVQELVKIAHQDQNRPRANAIRAMLAMNAGHAIAALTQMLHDRRPAHRNSALWVVQAMGLIEVARHVAEMSITDTDPGVKSHAADVVQDLLGLMKLEAKGKQPRSKSA